MMHAWIISTGALTVSVPVLIAWYPTIYRIFQLLFSLQVLFLSLWCFDCSLDGRCVALKPFCTSNPQRFFGSSSGDLLSPRMTSGITGELNETDSSSQMLFLCRFSNRSSLYHTSMFTWLLWVVFIYRFVRNVQCLVEIITKKLQIGCCLANQLKLKGKCTL